MRIKSVKYKARLIRQVQYIARVFGFYWAGKALARFRIPASHALQILKGIRSQNLIAAR
jgi:hypothetical protein